jgi:hypothetical protein
MLSCFALAPVRQTSARDTRSSSLLLPDQAQQEVHFATTSRDVHVLPEVVEIGVYLTQIFKCPISPRLTATTHGALARHVGALVALSS